MLSADFFLLIIPQYFLTMTFILLQMTISSCISLFVLKWEYTLPWKYMSWGSHYICLFEMCLMNTHNIQFLKNFFFLYLP